MTSPDLLKIAAIKAIIEAIEEGDAKDASQALKMIEGLMGNGEK